MSEFEGRAVLVTGGSSGIGRAAAVAFAAQGARVAIVARGRDRGEAVVAEIEANGGDAFFLESDQGRMSQVEGMVQRVVARFGRLDIAVNNAAGTTGAFHATADFDEAEYDETMAVNLKAVWLAMKHEITQMLAQSPSGGAIVNTSSVNGLGGAPLGSLYAASKAGVLALTKSAAMEYGPAGIRINALVPGAFDTPMLRTVFDQIGDAEAAQESYEARIPLGRLGDPAEAAQAIVWLCSDAASYLIGHSLIVDGGMSAAFR